jgi:hypothetical protein
MSRRSTGSSSRFNLDSTDDISETSNGLNNSYPLRSLARNRSLSTRINMAGKTQQDQLDELSASPTSSNRLSGFGIWGSSRKSRDSDGHEEEGNLQDSSRLNDNEYEGGALSRGSVEQERLLRNSAGVEGAWGEDIARKPVSQA